MLFDSGLLEISNSNYPKFFLTSFFLTLTFLWTFLFLTFKNLDTPACFSRLKPLKMVCTTRQLRHNLLSLHCGLQAKQHKSSKLQNVVLLYLEIKERLARVDRTNKRQRQERHWEHRNGTSPRSHSRARTVKQRSVNDSGQQLLLHSVRHSPQLLNVSRALRLYRRNKQLLKTVQRSLTLHLRGYTTLLAGPPRPCILLHKLNHR